MRLIKPKPITDAVLVYSSVPENEYPLWSGLVSYSIGSRVIDQTIHRVYESSVNANINKLPANNPDVWTEVSTSNRWAMFDESVSTLTESETTIRTKFLTDTPCTALALLDLKGHSVTVSVEYNEQTVYETSVTLTEVDNTADWFSYSFSDTLSRTSVVLLDLPGYVGAIVTVVIEAQSEGAAVGLCILGKARDVGITTYGASMGIQDYSQKQRDDFGRISIVERSFSKKGNFVVEVPHKQYDATFKYLSSLRATPVLYIGTDIFESTLIYGFYKDFSMVISYPTYGTCSLEIEGLT